ncbi:1D-myo-inositol 2-acetamido-2-deoxy-alpha-D-glucopyranoside deacetylase [Planctopirus ephydatiae]|jgi:LmbE family N-acetylglucosaminyl deacetylase|uniref:1D-myo-inositol 2-acetamido-2-deoxy-alpha-D-glucopyranoside deacetylase n=1 Tax=Planctopirus ephydatiae TaxID=2528019 RepID=A0A518GRL0_9PLAN|nr:PIG-L family deacetylase [Planctopirus ephydatiae]QDV31235.1 1D-myo-inositol 2-acetamido-2-deoxy-alpha-D-glucopyranoside deacetylase [Planctopirus ephydatiae]
MSRDILTSNHDELDVIAVGAHPDDVEIGCGGTLAAFVQRGYRVGIVDLTDGEPTPLSSGRESRLEESRLAAETLGIHMRHNLLITNRTLFDGFGQRVALARIFRKYRPRIVLGIAGKTPMASPDHWQAAQITDAAVFYSRLSKWDDEFGDLPVHTISKQFWYSLSLSSLDSLSGPNSFVMDISATLPQKIASVRAYESQFPPTKDRVFRLIEGTSRCAGASCGFEAGEVLFSVTTLGVSDPIEAFLPSRQKSAPSTSEKSQ